MYIGRAREIGLIYRKKERQANATIPWVRAV